MGRDRGKNPSTRSRGNSYGQSSVSDSLDLQRRADELAVRLSGDDRLLVFELRSAIAERDERLARIRGAVG